MITNAQTPIILRTDERTVYVLEESGVRYDPDDPNDDRVWMQGPIDCAICLLGVDDDTIDIYYPDSLDVITCPDCGCTMEPPHLAQYERDENGQWCLRDEALETDDDGEDDDDAESWAAVAH